MAFCGYCGKPVDDNIKFCPYCGAKAEFPKINVVDADKCKNDLNGKELKSFAIGMILFVVLCFSATHLNLPTDHPCDWCGNSPSYEYEVRNGSYSYVCKDCSKRCVYCNKKATKHYVNGFGVQTFVCRDCYKEIISLNRA